MLKCTEAIAVRETCHGGMFALCSVAEDDIISYYGGVRNINI